MIYMSTAVEFGLLLVLAGIVLALWDHGRTKIKSQVQRQDQLAALVSGLADNLTVLATKLDESNEYVRRVLSTFLSSATDIITLSVEEKKQIQNKLTAEAVNKWGRR
jgi:hypothetical protein